MKNPIDFLFGNSQKKAMKSFSQIVFTIKKSSSRSMFGGAAGSYSESEPLTEEEQKTWIIISLIIIALYLLLLAIGYGFIHFERTQSKDISSHKPLHSSEDQEKDQDGNNLDDDTPRKGGSEGVANDMSIEEDLDYGLDDSAVDETIDIDVESFTIDLLTYGVQVQSWKDGISKPKTLKLTEKGELHLLSAAMASLNSFSPVKVGVQNCGSIWRVVNVYLMAAKKVKSATFGIDTASQKLHLSIQRTEKRFDKPLALVRGLKAIAKRSKENAKFVDEMVVKSKTNKTI